MSNRKGRVDTVNIWYSPGIKRWVVCALVVPFSRASHLIREKTRHVTFAKAVRFAAKSYKGAA